MIDNLNNEKDKNRNITLGYLLLSKYDFVNYKNYILKDKYE